MFGIEKDGPEILVGVLPGGFFFIWTLLTIGATGLVAFVLAVQAIWGLRRRRRASA